MQYFKNVLVIMLMVGGLAGVFSGCATDNSGSSYDIDGGSYMGGWYRWTVLSGQARLYSTWHADAMAIELISDGSILAYGRQFDTEEDDGWNTVLTQPFTVIFILDRHGEATLELLVDYYYYPAGSTVVDGEPIPESWYTYMNPTYRDGFAVEGDDWDLVEIPVYPPAGVGAVDVYLLKTGPDGASVSQLWIRDWIE